MTEANSQQIADWNGRNGDRWLANQARLDAMLDAAGSAAITAAAVQRGEAILDIGCGAGASSLMLAERAGPDGSVIGVDVSEPLIARAQTRAAGIANLSFRLADAATERFAAHAHDLLFSRLGVMFFDDPIAALGNLRIALKPGGRLACLCWRTAAENDWIRLPAAALDGIVPPQPALPVGAPGPFSFGEESRVRHILSESGFERIALEPLDLKLRFGIGDDREAAIADAIDQAWQVGPLARMLGDQPDDVRRRGEQAVRAAFAGRATADGVLIDGAAWIVTARSRA